MEEVAKLASMANPIYSKVSTSDLGGPRPDRRRHLLVTVHGIRTFGRWQERLEAIVRSSLGPKDELQVFNFKFGYFSVFAFLVPFLRWLVTRRFRQKFLKVVQDGSWDQIDLIGHSFGTHVIGWGLNGIVPERRPKVHTVILAGSVLKSSFPWDDLVGKHIERVVNDCGTRDKILLLSQFLVLFTGMAGKVGFAGMTGSRLRNRYFDFGHSGYFIQNGKPDDSFMRQYWLPLIVTDASVTIVDERKDGIFVGPVAFLANNAEPIKLTFYITPLLLGIFGIFGLYVKAEEQRHEALSRALALESREASENPELSVRLSLEAMRFRDTVEARRSLISAMTRSLGQEGFTYLCCAAGAVTAMTFSDKGERLFTGDIKGSVLKWSLGEDTPRALGDALEGEVLRIGLTNDGRRLVAIAAKQISVFDLETKPERQTAVELPFAPISSVALSADGKLLAVGNRSGLIAVLDRHANKWSAPFMDSKFQKRVLSLAFQGAGPWLAASYQIDPVPGFQHPILLWNVSTGHRLERTFQGHRFEVVSLDFSPDGKQLASGSWDHDIRLWDAATAQTIPPVFVGAAQDSGAQTPGISPTTVAISPDGQILASIMGDTAALWDMSNHKILAQLSGLIHATALAFDENGKYLALGGADRNIVLIPVDGDYWFKRACAMGLPELTAEQRRYYLGDSKGRGSAASWLWKAYWSVQAVRESLLRTFLPSRDTVLTTSRGESLHCPE